MEENLKLDGAQLDLYRGVVNNIADALRNGEVGFLFGAGLSHDAPSDLPLGRVLAQRVLRRAFKGSSQVDAPDDRLDRFADTVPFEAILEAASKKLPSEKDLLDFLKAELAWSDPRINDGHRALLRMQSTLPGSFPEQLFTTNFDLLLEAAFKGSKTVVESRSERLNEAEREGKLAIVHLHGALGNEVQDAREIWQPEHEILAQDHPLHDAFATQFYRKIFVFVGYSLSDADLRRSYFKVWYQRQQASAQKKAYVVSPVRSPMECTVASEIWNSRFAEFIPVPASQFLSDVADMFCNKDEAFFRQSVIAEVGAEKMGELTAGVKAISEAFPDIDETRLYEYLHSRTAKRRG